LPPVIRHSLEDIITAAATSGVDVAGLRVPCDPHQAIIEIETLALLVDDTSLFPATPMHTN
jgi:hypothetical protein